LYQFVCRDLTHVSSKANESQLSLTEDIEIKSYCDETETDYKR